MRDTSSHWYRAEGDRSPDDDTFFSLLSVNSVKKKMTNLKEKKKREADDIEYRMYVKNSLGVFVCKTKSWRQEQYFKIYSQYFSLCFVGLFLWITDASGD